MNQKIILRRMMKWLLILLLSLPFLLSVVSCSDDIVGPQIRDKEEDKKEDGTGEDPSDGSGMMGTIRFIWPDSNKYSWT